MTKYLFILIFFSTHPQSFASALLVKDSLNKQIKVQAQINIYGNLATSQLAEAITNEINTVWNQQHYQVIRSDGRYDVRFQIKVVAMTLLKAQRNWDQNQSPYYNYIRIIKEPNANITSSFIVGNTNSGIWMLSHALGSSTTAAHEFGHSIGLNHPEDGPVSGQPGIMVTNYYPVDKSYWIDPNAEEGSEDSKLDLRKRKVLDSDMANFKLENLEFNSQQQAQLGSARFVFFYDEEGNII